MMFWVFCSVSLVHPFGLMLSTSESEFCISLLFFLILMQLQVAYLCITQKASCGYKSGVLANLRYVVQLNSLSQ